MYSPLTSMRNSLIIKKLITSNIPGKCSKTPENFAEVSFSIDLTKKQRKSGWNVLHIREYDATYAKFKTF